MGEPQDSELFEVTAAAVREARDRALAHRDAGRYVPRRHDFPQLSHFDSGQPNVRRGIGTQVPNYSGLFGPHTNASTPYSYEDLPRTQALVELARQRPVLRERWNPPLAENVSEELRAGAELFFDYMAAGFAYDILDRLLHVIGDEFSDEQLKEVYCEAERGALDEKLPVDIVVPILLITFEDDRRSVTERIVLERLSEEEQLARAPVSHSIAAVPEPLAGAATHAFVLTGWVIDNGNRWTLRTGDASFYPREQIETCFEALRLATPVETGYAQIYMRPKGWVHDWMAHLPPIIPGPLVRRYPPHFDNFGWLREPASVDQDHARAVSEVFGELASASPQLQLAARRLSDALLRDRDGRHRG